MDAIIEKTLLILIFLAFVLLANKVHVSKPLFLFLLYALSYPLFLVPSFWADIPFCVYTEYQNSEFSIKNLLIFFIFILTTAVFIKKRSNRETLYIGEKVHRQNNIPIFVFFFIILNIIAWFGFGGETIVEKGGYDALTQNEGIERLGGLDLKEYFLVFYMLCFLYSKQRSLNILLIIIGILFSIKCLVFGGRIELLQLFLLNFILYIDSKRISFKAILFLFLIGFYLLMLFGKLRANPLGILNQDWLEIINIFDNDEQSVIISNQGDVFYATSRMIGLVDDGIWDLSTRIGSLYANIVRIILPKSILPEYTELSIYLKQEHPTGGGGLITGYFYVWFDVFSPFIAGFLLSKLINLFLFSKNQISIVYVIMVFSTYPRWFAYFPTSLYKLCLYPVVLLIILNQIKKAH